MSPHTITAPEPEQISSLDRLVDDHSLNALRRQAQRDTHWSDHDSERLVEQHQSYRKQPHERVTQGFLRGPR